MGIKDAILWIPNCQSSYLSEGGSNVLDQTRLTISLLVRLVAGSSITALHTVRVESWPKAPKTVSN